MSYNDGDTLGCGDTAAHDYHWHYSWDGAEVFCPGVPTATYAIEVLSNDGWDGLEDDTKQTPRHAVIQYLAAIERFGTDGLKFRVTDENTGTVTIIDGYTLNREDTTP